MVHDTVADVGAHPDNPLTRITRALGRNVSSRQSRRHAAQVTQDSCLGPGSHVVALRRHSDKVVRTADKSGRSGVAARTSSIWRTLRRLVVVGIARRGSTSCENSSIPTSARVDRGRSY